MDNRTFILTHLPKLSEIDIRTILSGYLTEIDKYIVEKSSSGSFIYIDKIPDNIIDRIRESMKPYVG